MVQGLCFRATWKNKVCNQRLGDKDFYELLLVSFSQTVREVSNNKRGEFKRFRLSERELSKFNPDVLYVFDKNLNDYFNRLRFDKVEFKYQNIGLYRTDTKKIFPLM